MRRFSVLGDSISTFEGCNPEGFRVYYEGARRQAAGVLSPADTWWAQVIDQCGGIPLRNGSFSGSMVEGAGFPAANSQQRIEALAKESVLPDAILVFIGINDYGWGGADAQMAGRGNALPQNLEVSSVPERTAGVAPVNTTEGFAVAYSAMLKRICAAYPQAEVWCCTLCPGRVAGSDHSTFTYRLRGIHFDSYNEAIRVAARQNGCLIADVRALGCDYEAVDGTHPTKRGMQQLAQMVLRAMEIERQGSRTCGEQDKAAVKADRYAGAPQSVETCDKLTCVGCSRAASTGNAWLLVCEEEGQRVPCCR